MALYDYKRGTLDKWHTLVIEPGVVLLAYTNLGRLTLWSCIPSAQCSHSGLSLVDQLHKCFVDINDQGSPVWIRMLTWMEFICFGATKTPNKHSTRSLGDFPELYSWFLSIDKAFSSMSTGTSSHVGLYHDLDSLARSEVFKRLVGL